MSLKRATEAANGIFPFAASVCRKSPWHGCFLLCFFDFCVGVFGALPPFPTSFLEPKKEAKKESAALPHSVFLLNAVFFYRLWRFRRKSFLSCFKLAVIKLCIEAVLSEKLLMIA